MSVASPPRLLALHGLRLHGRAEAATVAEYMGAEVDVIEDALLSLEAEALVDHRIGRFPGFGLTPDGRAEGERLLAEELDGHGLRPHVEAAYEEFLVYNRQLLHICTSWQ